MVPQRQRFLVDIAAEVMADESQRIGISYIGFCLTSLPHKRLPDEMTWEKGHHVTLSPSPAPNPIRLGQLCEKRATSSVRGSLFYVLLRRGAGSKCGRQRLPSVSSQPPEWVATSCKLVEPSGARAGITRCQSNDSAEIRRPDGLIVYRQINHVDPRAWLADVLTRIIDHPNRGRLGDLSPWNWRKGAPRRARRHAAPAHHISLASTSDRTAVFRGWIRILRAE